MKLAVERQRRAVRSGQLTVEPGNGVRPGAAMVSTLPSGS